MKKTDTTYLKGKFTKAPWKAVHEAGYFPHVLHNLERVQYEGHQPNGESSIIHSQNEADADLIAAAPDMYEALLMMQLLLDDIFKSNNIGKLCFQDYTRLNEAPLKAAMAIAKAEGVIK